MDGGEARGVTKWRRERIEKGNRERIEIESDSTGRSEILG